MHAIHGIASGRVQGVFYRASLQREAQKRGLTGWVRNRADGTVEFVVQGDAGAVESIVEWANGGPSGARVIGVEIAEIRCDSSLRQFEIHR